MPHLALALTLQMGEPASEPYDPSAPGTLAEDTGEVYGWQTIFCDFASIGHMIAGGFLEFAPAAGAGAIVLLLGTPVIHFVHENAGIGFTSLGVRLGSALLGFGGIVFPPAAILGGLCLLLMIFIDAAIAVAPPEPAESASIAELGRF